MDQGATENEQETPVLDGIRVVEAATMIMVPCVGAVMSDFGAEVIKVEPEIGDLNRRGHLIPGMPKSDVEYTYYQDNRNKKSVVVNLKTESGLDVLYKLLANADVFLTNYRDSALKKLKIDYETLRAINPRLIFAHGTGYGDKGDEATKPGYDTVTYYARSGLEQTFFPETGMLTSLGYATGDHPSGMSLFSGVMLALFKRLQTGKGCRVTTSLLACGAWSNSSLIQAKLMGAEFLERLPRDQSRNYSATYYRTRDDRVFKMTVVDHNKTWPGIAQAIGRPEWADDPRFDRDLLPNESPELVRFLDKKFAEHDLDYWLEQFREFDVPCSALASLDEVASDQQMIANDILMEVEDEQLGSVRTVNSPVTIDEHPKVPPRPAPGLGADTEAVLAELGIVGAPYQALLDEGAVS